MTAYIKIIDVWMIFTMLYPFCAVILYALQEFLMEMDRNIPIGFTEDKRRMMTERATLLVRFMLYKGLPLLAVIFISTFWSLGINNTSVGIDQPC